jgi:hypothetical protein
MLKQLQARQLQSWSQAGFGASAQPTTRYYNLAGSLDLLVLPSKHIISKRAFWSCWLPHVGHYSILMSDTFWDQVPPAPCCPIPPIPCPWPLTPYPMPLTIVRLLRAWGVVRGWLRAARGRVAVWAGGGVGGR